mgnify:CR=1 FL=1
MLAFAMHYSCANQSDQQTAPPPGAAVFYFNIIHNVVAETIRFYIQTTAGLNVQLLTLSPTTQDTKTYILNS